MGLREHLALNAKDSSLPAPAYLEMFFHVRSLSLNTSL